MYVLPTDTLEIVINKIHENKIHRVFIVTDDHKLNPVGIISLQDILWEVISHI